MEQSLQINNRQLASILMLKQLAHLNCLSRSFPISDSMLEIWAESLMELEPEITPDVIKWIINQMKMGFISYNQNEGMQNIFNGFRKYIDFQNSKREPGSPLNKWNELYKKYNTNKNNIPNAIG